MPFRHTSTHVRKVLDAADVGTWTYDLSEETVHFDAAAQRILFGNKEAASVAFEKALEAIHPDDRQAALEELRRTLDAGTEGYYRIDTRIVLPDETVRWVSVKGRVVTEAPRTGPSSLLGVILDISDRKQIEVESRALSEANARLNQEVQRRKELEKEVLKATDEERARVAREVHDGLQQHLTGLSLKLSILEDALAAEGSPSRDRLKSARSDLSRIMEQARRLTRRLMPIAVQERGLDGSLEKLATKLDDESGCRVSFESTGEVYVDSAETATNIYRIAQEAITNALKHANCRSIRVELTRENDRGVLRVEDDGTGFDPEEARETNGIGLSTMAYRADLIGGELRIESTLQKGTSVSCIFPLS